MAECTALARPPRGVVVYIRRGRRCGVGPAHARVTVTAGEIVGRSGWVVLGSPSCALRATTSGNSTPVDVEGRRWQAAFCRFYVARLRKGQVKPEALIQR